MPSRKSRCSGATTSPATPCSASAAPAVSTPAGWRTRSAWSASCSTRWPGCSPPTAWAWPTSAPCASARSTGRSPGWRSRTACGQRPSRSAGRLRPRSRASARPVTRWNWWSPRSCATRAATPFCRSRSPTNRPCARPSRRPTGTGSASYPWTGRWWWNRSWSRPSAAPTPRRTRNCRSTRGRRPPRARSGCGTRAAGVRRRSSGASSCTPASACAARRSSSSPSPRWWSSRAGRPR